MPEAPAPSGPVTASIPPPTARAALPSALVDGDDADRPGPATPVSDLPLPPGTDEGAHTWAFEAIGTQWQVTTPTPLSAEVRHSVTRTIEDYDRAFSRFRDDSLVAEMSRRAGTFELPACTGELLETYALLAGLTHGAVNPLVGASLEHLGYGADYRLQPLAGHLPAPVWDEVCTWDGIRLTTTIPVTLDVGAVGKGQLVDLVADEIRACGIGTVLVDAGGDLVSTGPPRRIGLEDPEDPDRVIGVVTCTGGAVCGSSTNRRAWAPGLHHVLDARTGRPVRGIRATWAAAPRAMLADAATTALFFEGPARVSRVLGVDALVLTDDRRAAWSEVGGPVAVGSPGGAGGDGGGAWSGGRWEVFA